MKTTGLCSLLLGSAGLASADAATNQWLNISGIYPHLAMFNDVKSGECGVGAVVPWADKLWVLTYPPHEPKGSADKLYEIAPDLSATIRPESVGGTHAGRLIHRESNQLVLGPYFIDAAGAVRAADLQQLTGRLTAVARHLTDPAHKVYIYDMEGALYEVDVKSLAVIKLFAKPVPGWHGKGAYTAQGRLVIANNGESHVGNEKHDYIAGADATNAEEAGVLAEWDGKTWRIVERRQFTEVTGPGGVRGAPDDTAPLWSVGWDKRSVLLKLLDGGRWQTFRLPRADHSFDGTHGWHTEWPRIREVAPGKFLMNMHGGWFDFPKTFSAANTGGLRPIASHLKITGDFCGWQDRVVFGCDALALSDFGSGNAIIAGHQSQSNLWFSRWNELARCGRPAGWGGPWLHDAVKAGVPSLPFLLAGYTQRVVHLAHNADAPVTFTLAVDGNKYQAITVPAHGWVARVIPAGVTGEWIRVSIDRDCADTTAYFHYGPGGGTVMDRELFAALADAGEATRGGTVVARGGDKRTLLFQTDRLLEIGPDLKFREADAAAAEQMNIERPGKAAMTVEVDDASVIVTEGSKRFQLPKSTNEEVGPPRLREVVTERSLLNAGGSFFVVPRPNSGGVARLKPVCAHNKRLTDFCSWRGLLVLAGTRKDAKPDGHYFATDDGMAGLWFGDVDDLWKIGKPVGRGGPWSNTAVKAGAASDPYLMTGYDRKSLELSHDATEEVAITIEVDFDHTGWHSYQTIKVPARQIVTHNFPEGFSAHWARVTASKGCNATAHFIYQ